MPACRPASRALAMKTLLCYSIQRCLYWPFCLFNTETCFVFDWFHSNYCCLCFTRTTSPLLWLETNESNDLTVFNWTTLKWKLQDKIQVSESEALNETYRLIRCLCWDFLFWNTIPGSRWGGTAAADPCADVYEWTWESSTALSPLLTSFHRTLDTCKHAHPLRDDNKSKQRACKHNMTELMTSQNSTNDLNLQIPCFSTLAALL